MLAKIGFDFDVKQLEACRFKDVVEFYRAYRYELLTPYVVVNGLPIHFNPDFQRIGINLSAGTDSTLLLYILCRTIEKLRLNVKIYPISVVRYWEHHAWSERAKADVYQWFKDRYPTIIKRQRWGFIPTAYEMTKITQINLDPREQKDYPDPTCNSDVYFFRSFNNYMANKLRLDAVYSGTTCNPIDNTMPSAPGFRDVRQLRFPDSLQGNQRYINAINDHWFTHVDPFALIEKNWILAQYDNFGLQDLLKMTRSCVESDDPVAGCGRLECFHCKERFWAIDNRSMFLKKNLKTR